MKNEKSGPLKS